MKLWTAAVMAAAAVMVSSHASSAAPVDAMAARAVSDAGLMHRTQMGSTAGGPGRVAPMQRAPAAPRMAPAAPRMAPMAPRMAPPNGGYAPRTAAPGYQPRMQQPYQPRVVQPYQQRVAPNYAPTYQQRVAPRYAPGYAPRYAPRYAPGYAPRRFGYINRPYRTRYWRPGYGWAVGSIVAVGVLSAAAAAAYAPPPPYADACWYYSDETYQVGYWADCQY